MNNQLVKFGLVICIVAVVAYFVVEPIVYNKDEYRVVVVNTSEHPISSFTITGAGQNSGKIGPIHVGMLNEFTFTPNKNGVLEYLINQNGREFSGVVNDNLKVNDTGQIFVVVNEMYKIHIADEYASSEFLGVQ